MVAKGKGRLNGDILRRSKKKDAVLKPDFDSLPVVGETKLKKAFKVGVSAGGG